MLLKSWHPKLNRLYMWSKLHQIITIIRDIPIPKTLRVRNVFLKQDFFKNEDLGGETHVLPKSVLFWKIKHLTRFYQSDKIWTEQLERRLMSVTSCYSNIICNSIAGTLPSYSSTKQIMHPERKDIKIRVCPFTFNKSFKNDKLWSPRLPN